MPRLRASERAALRAKPWDSTSARLPRAKKAELVKTPWLSPMIALTIAAVDIQRMTRGHQVRRLGIKNYPPKKKPPPPSRPQLDKYLRAMRGSREKADDGFSSWCAVRMQVGRLNATRARPPRTPALSARGLPEVVVFSLAALQKLDLISDVSPLPGVVAHGRRAAAVLSYSLFALSGRCRGTHGVKRTNERMYGAIEFAARGDVKSRRPSASAHAQSVHRMP